MIRHFFRAVINNAIWPLTLSELREQSAGALEEVAQATSLDTIQEEKRFVDLPSSEGAATIEILTIEITEIPIIDDDGVTTSSDAEAEQTESQKADGEN